MPKQSLKSIKNYKIFKKIVFIRFFILCKKFSSQNFEKQKKTEKKRNNKRKKQPLVFGFCLFFFFFSLFCLLFPFLEIAQSTRGRKGRARKDRNKV